MQHLDEGTIHAWLDGALAPDESRRVEAHAASCDTCSALVAEARGLIAASSRILTGLDEVPAGVIPVREGESAMVPDDLAAMRARKAVAELSRRRRWWRRPRVMAAAGIVFVAAGTFAVMQQGSPRFAPAVASDQATEAAPPQPVTAPAPSLSASAVDRIDSSRTTAPTLARPGAAAPTEGRLAKEEAASREKTEAPQEQRRELAATPSRSATQRADRAEAMKQYVQGQAAGAQGGAQVPAAPATQQQTPPVAQLSAPASANRLSQVTVPPSRPVRADSVSALERARERDVPVAEPLSDRSSPEKALLVYLFSGCYQIRPFAGARGPSLVPEVIMLDTVVAVTRGDTAWYRARTLDAAWPDDVELTWRRVSQITESAAPLMEISMRREQTTAVFVVAVERFTDVRSGVTTTAAGATAKATDARAATPRPPTPANAAPPSASAATYAARQTSCPRR